jgi:outer membrane protein assembly factor BamB
VAGRVDDDGEPLGRALAAVALVVALLGAGAYLRFRHRVPTIRGSTTTEYVPAAPHARPRKPGVAWPTYGYDAQRTRAASFDLRPPFRRVWTFHAQSLLEFPPAVGYGDVYVETFDGRLIAVRASTGKAVWRYASHRCGWASPALARRAVYVTFIGSGECRSRARDGEVVAFDARTGRLRWLRRIGPTESSPLVAHGLVYVGDWDGRIWALDARTGRARWTTQLHGAVKGSLSASGGSLYIGTYDGDVVALAARGGRVLWTSGGHGSIYSSPAVAHGRVYVGSLDDGVYAFGAATGRLLWARPTGGYVYASPAVWRDLVLVGSYDHRFYALDAGTGDVRWSFHADGPISGSASVVGGLVWFSTFSRTTYALDAASGTAGASFPDGKYSAVVADARRLFLAGLGRLYALGPRSPPPVGDRGLRARS